MPLLHGRLPRLVARALGYPPGVGGLLTAPIRIRLVASTIGSILLSLLDMVGVLTMLPLMQFIAGQDRDTGALGLINRAIGEPGDRGLVMVLAAIIAGAFILKDVFSVFFRRWQLHFMATQEVEISSQVLRNYLVGPYNWHLVKNTGDKLWLAEFAVSAGFSGGLAAALSVMTELASITMIAVSLTLISPLVTLIAVLYFGASAYAMQRFLRPRITATSQEGMEAARETSTSALQAMGAVKEIKLRQAHEPFVDRYRDGRLRGARAGANRALLNELPKYLLEIMFVVGLGLLAWVASSNSTPGHGLVVLGVFVAASSRILPSIVRLMGGFNGVRAARAPLIAVIHELHNQQQAQIDEGVRPSTDEVPRGDIEATDLEYAYSDEPDMLVLKGVSLSIPQGSSVALVGASGSGKSTLVDLILGLHKPVRGVIRVGGIDIRDNLPAWQRQLAVVPQEVYLLDDTLQNNITFDAAPEKARLSEVLERAQLSDLIASLPLGLATPVGERGARLSGGQRQRIGIARALYRNPAVLVLDEATSALDNETEHRFSETIASLKGSVTVVIVAHRLSTVRQCDQLIFMSDGLVATTGSFDEVRENNPEFAHLVQLGALVQPDRSIALGGLMGHGEG